MIDKTIINNDLSTLDNLYRSLIDSMDISKLSSDSTEKVAVIIKEFIKVKNKYEMFNKNENGNFDSLITLNDLDEEIKNLANEIKKVCTNLPTVFKAHENRTLGKRIYDSTIGGVVDKLSEPLLKKAYVGATRQAESKTLPGKIEQLKTELFFISERQIEIQNEMTNYEIEIENETDPKKIVLLQSNFNQGKAEFSALSLQYDSIYEKLEDLIEINSLQEMYTEKKKQLHIDHNTIGGERITLTTPDQVKIDGAFLDANQFRNKLAEAGCQLATISLTNQISESPIQMNGIFLSKEDYAKSGKAVIDALTNLKAFAANSNKIDFDPRAGWSIVHKGDDIIIVNANELTSKGNISKASSSFVNFNEAKQIWEIRQETLNPIKIDLFPINVNSPASGTVILSSGNVGTYEQHKTESMFFLIRNMNVMLFNFRGYGSSEGTPTPSGLDLDMETAYQYVKQRSSHSDEQIVFKALCMSGASAAYVSSNHPNTNIIVDQTYSNLQRLAQDYIRSNLEHYVENKENGFGLNEKQIPTIAKVVNLLTSMAVPKIAVDQYLAKNNGYKAIFYTHSDEVIDLNNVIENVKAVANAGKLNSLTLFSAPGKHTQSVVRVKASTHDFAVKEIQKNEKKLQEIGKQLSILNQKKRRPLSENERDKLDKDITALEIERGKIEITLEDLEGETMATGQAQIDYFLQKAHLADPIIKPNQFLFQTL